MMSVHDVLRFAVKFVMHKIAEVCTVVKCTCISDCFISRSGLLLGTEAPRVTPKGIDLFGLNAAHVTETSAGLCTNAQEALRGIQIKQVSQKRAKQI